MRYSVVAIIASLAVVNATPQVSQIPDGQIQAPTVTAPPVSQISDGQPQVPTGANTTVATPTITPFTGAASSTYEYSGVLALFGAAFGLLV